VFFSFGKIPQAGEKKKTVANPTKGFWGIFKILNRHILRRKKKLEVAIFRKCVPVGRQN
jgi:hypothetical protein